jgi:hypothetical protein
VTRSGRAAHRLLGLGIVASTNRLVRLVRDRSEDGPIRELMVERRRLLCALATSHWDSENLHCLDAVRSAVAESDRTLEALL